MTLRTDRRGFIGGAAATALVAATGARAAPTTSAAAAAVYRRATVIDALGGLSVFDPADRPDIAMLPRFLAEARGSGVTAVNLTVGSVGNGSDKFEDAVTAIAGYEQLLAKHSDVYLKIRTGADLGTAKVANKVGLIYGFQDTTMLGADLDRLDTFHALGVRIVQPTYNRRNLMGDGCLEPANGGLSLLGRELIAALNEHRMLIDLSHAGSRVQAESIALSKRPPAITHSGCRALNDNPRNTHDAELRALAGKGGVLGIYFMPFLRARGQQRAADVIRHIEHAVRVAGEDHVGLGTDGGIPALLDEKGYRASLIDVDKQRRAAGIAAPGEDPDVLLYVPDYNGPRKFERLADDLLKRGHSTGRVEKILGGNFARLFTEVWG